MDLIRQASSPSRWLTLQPLSRPLNSKTSTKTSHLRIEEAEHIKTFRHKIMKNQNIFFRIIANWRKNYSNLQNIRITPLTIIFNPQRPPTFSCVKNKKHLKKIVPNYAKTRIKIIVLYPNAIPWLFHKTFTVLTYLLVVVLHQNLWPAKTSTIKHGLKW
jgi:hypothetical protein